MLHEKRLVAGRRNLSHKNHVVGIHDWLRLVGQVRMNRVPHLVRQRELAVKCSRIVEKHIRMHTRARRVRARALAGIFIHVNPAIVKALLQDLPVPLAHDAKRLRDGLLCLCKGNPLLRRGNQRRIEIVHMKLADAQKLFAKPHVPMHLVHVLVHGFDQLMVYADRNLRCVQRRFQRGSVVPRL